MNIFYKPPNYVTNFSQIDDFYNNRKYLIILYHRFNIYDSVFYSFIQSIQIPRVRAYFNICDFPQEQEHSNALNKGIEKYKSNPNLYYNDFWLSDVNLDILKNFKRNEQRQSLFEVNMLQKYIESVHTNQQHEKIMLYTFKRTSFTLEKIIKICEQELRVLIKKRVTLFCILGYALYDVYDKEKNTHIGSFYYYNANVAPCTMPLGRSISLVTSPLTEQLIHEIVHAVQYSYNAFYDYSKEIVEIPAMLIERKYMCDNENIWTKIIDKQIALALADLVSDDPITFNNTFNKICQQDPPINVVGRFWHYVHYPKQYYSYVLGLILPLTLPIIDMVKNPTTCYMVVLRHINNTLLKN